MGSASVGQDTPQPSFLLSGKGGGGGPPASDQDLFQGTWQIVSVTHGGQSVAKMYGLKIKFHDNEVLILDPTGNKEHTGTFKLFPSKSPRAIDLIPDEGESGGMMLGIYRFEGDELHLNMDDYNKGRPTIFASPSGASSDYLVLKRAGGKTAKGTGGQAELQQLLAENQKLKAQLYKLEAELAVMKKLLPAKDQKINQADLDALLKQYYLQVEKEKKAAEAAVQDLLAQKKAAYDAAMQAAADKDAAAMLALIKENAARMVSSNNLKQIALAMHVYADVHKRLPAANIYGKNGKPLLSWRVAILPWIEQEHLYKQFKLDEPWDSPHNLKLLDQMPKLYAPVGAAAKKVKDKHSTFYQVFTGPKTLFDGSVGKTFADVTDGTSKRSWLWKPARRCPGPSPPTWSTRLVSPCRSLAVFSRVASTWPWLTVRSALCRLISTRTSSDC
jgi:uncharacterized protein (TIGR03067 family)